VHVEAAARLTLARDVIAPRVRELTLRWFQSLDLKPERKSDGSVVTPVDREAEDIIRGMLAREFPDDGILGEERGETLRAASPWRWVLDPIDGTGSYVRGLPHWVLLIGIEHEGEPVAGLIDAPAVNESLWAVRGGGATWRHRNGEERPARASSVSELRRAMIEIAPVQWFAQHGRLEVHSRLCARTRRNRGWSDGYAFALVATGRVDAAINFGFHRWDLSACAAILDEAGGQLTDWQGRRDLEAMDVIASNAALHGALLEALSANA
jgi:histidinol phosphatase-like enzyme (inositol monophosphatase family)